MITICSDHNLIFHLTHPCGCIDRNLKNGGLNTWRREELARLTIYTAIGEGQEKFYICLRYKNFLVLCPLCTLRLNALKGNYKGNTSCSHIQVQ